MNMKIQEYENKHMNNRAILYYYVLIQVYMMPDAYIECYK